MALCADSDDLEGDDLIFTKLMNLMTLMVIEIIRRYINGNVLTVTKKFVMLMMMVM